MKILLDRHVLVWFLEDSSRLSRNALAVIEADDTITCVSAVTAWELANKVRRGKWPEAAGLVEGFFEMMEHYNVVPLPITLDHARLAGSLPGRHRDPFDRMLAAQARIEDVPLVTADPAFRRFDIATLW